jgi:peptidoglycan/xylan/chitin deacetylase (PgdA/CDA1 family)
VFLFTGELASSKDGAAIVRRIAAEGHELANHTRSHADLTKIDLADVGAELDDAEGFVAGATGKTTRPFFREPFLAANDDVDRVVRERCYRSIWFTVDTGDWQKGKTSDDIVRAVLEHHGAPRDIASGSIFIFHGSQPENVVALPKIIGELRRRGFAFLTLGEALRAARPPQSSPPDPK